MCDLFVSNGDQLFWRNDENEFTLCEIGSRRGDAQILPEKKK